MGVEPMTCRLRIGCSTSKLRWRGEKVENNPQKSIRQIRQANTRWLLPTDFYHDLSKMGAALHVVVGFAHRFEGKNLVDDRPDPVLFQSPIQVFKHFTAADIDS